MKIRRLMPLFCTLLALLAALPAAFAQAPSGDGPRNRIEAMEVSQQGGTIYLRLTLREPLSAPPPSFSVADPARIAIDFPDTANGLGRTQQDIGQGDLRSANIVQAGNRTRLVLNLTQMTPFDTRLDGRHVVVALSPAAGEVAGATRVSQAMANFASAPGAAGDGGSVRDITFRRGKDGEGRVVVQLSDPNTGIDIRQQGGDLVVEFLETLLPEHLRRRSDVTDFATPITSMTAQQQGDNVRLVVSPNGLWEHNAYQSDNQFVLEVRRVVEDPNKLVQGGRTQYSGEKLSLNFQNIDVRSVLQVIADFTNFNIVMSDQVQGNVTLRLKDVPWDQALQVVLDSKGLSYSKNGSVIWVATVAEIEERHQAELRRSTLERSVEPLVQEVFQLNYHNATEVAALIKGKIDGAQTAIRSAGDGAARNTPLAASGSGSDTTTVQTDLNLGRSLLSERGAVTAEPRSNKLFVTDVAAARQAVRDFLKEVDVAPRQVLIEARIVEANKDFARDLGVRLGYGDRERQSLGGAKQAAFGKSSFRDDAITIRDGLLSGQESRNSLSRELGEAVVSGAGFLPENPFGSLNLTLFNKGLTRFLNLELAALESDGRGRVVSSPRILTSDLQKAVIKQGQEIPYVTPSTTTEPPTVEFKEAVLMLDVTPQITPDGRVKLKVNVNKDRADFSRSVQGNPPIDSKSIETDVFVENGGTVVIGGVFEEEEVSNVDRVPLLGEIPYLGALFRSTTTIKGRRELLIFITPRIVADTLTLR